LLKYHDFAWPATWLTRTVPLGDDPADVINEDGKLLAFRRWL
jgi:hypothetical protein